jgi:phage recombination protein Bet
MSTQALALASDFTTDQKRLIKDLLCPGMSDGELALFAEMCKAKGLDPFSQQIYAIKRSSGDEDESGERSKKLTIQIGIDGLRVMAERTGKYAGQDPVEWCGTDGKWMPVWLSTTPPIAARASVYKHGIPRPFVKVALFKEYAQRKRGGALTRMWQTMPANQIAKCAEAGALRLAFPYELGALHEPAEMDHTENPPLETTPAEHQAYTYSGPSAHDVKQPAAPAPPDVPAEVQGMMQIITNERSEGAMKVFSALRDELMRLTDEKRGTEIYLALLGKQGVESWQQFKRMSQFRAAVQSLWDYIQELKKPATPAPGVTDEDIPDAQPELFEHAEYPA